MSQTHTIVVHFPEGIAPRYSASTQFQGGDVVAVNFAGNRMDVADDLEEALSDLLYLVSASRNSEEFSQTTEVKVALKALEKARGSS